MNIYTITDFLTYTTYKDNKVVDVFQKVNIPESLFDLQYYDEYIIEEGDRWDSLADTFYGTPHLWWLIASYNKFIDPFPTLVVGQKINIIKPELVPNLLLTMKGYLK